MNANIDSGIELPLMESFFTIQGEGFYSGTPAYFLRIGGCDVGCYWCDVKDSWDPKIHPLISIDEIVNRVCYENHSNTVVVTGGEPLMWDMYTLTNLLHNKKYLVHLETSGSHKITGVWDWICLSPKKNEPPLKTIYSEVNELKIIVRNSDDFRWAETHRKFVSKKCVLYLQPEWSVRDKIMPKIVDYVLKNNGWKISLQTHKYLNIP
ncbi:MAG: 7-carboxy-7-deazaguanine synthase QueE [Flavobacteriales bacterium]|nr:7-carboxy-7-deazaguanine synthase QueE [Flavobacteriales bacterium]|tara:strand:- start:84 stop:707 length:624 start_codon:yes stop_codon:yes gene_type:complete